MTTPAATHGRTEADERDAVIAEFKRVVNMSASQLERWLASEDSKAAGWTHEGEHESVGHRSGTRIVTLLGKRKADCSDADVAHMKKVVGYVHRHLAQRPHGDVRDTRWRHSLMNWGHDPLRS